MRWRVNQVMAARVYPVLSLGGLAAEAAPSARSPPSARPHALMAIHLHSRTASSICSGRNP